MNMATIRVLAPTELQNRPGVIHKPFVLYAHLPRYTTILSVNALPNLLEVLGMASGGGPPGFTVIVPTLDPAQPKQYGYHHFIIAFLPGSEVRSGGPDFFLGNHIGTCISAGIVLNYFELVLREELQEATLEELQELFTRNGYELVQLSEYTTPEVLMGRLGAPQ